MLTRTHIMLHHSLTTDSETVSWAAIRRYHVETMGWRDIGYHYGVELVGERGGEQTIEALVGRPEDEIAAACKEGHMNESAIHVCFVGNYDNIAPSEELLVAACSRVILPLMHRYGIPADHIVGHRDYATYKTCPGKLFDLDRVRRMVT